MVECFKQTYIALCKEYHVEPQESVLGEIKAAQLSPKKGGALLNLSTHSLGVKTCSVLGKALSTDRVFTEIRLNDCMLPEEGVRALCHGLATNVACKKLDMKGNNIRASAAESLGRMLRDNKHLLSLCLEWNCLGMLETPFGVFCEGLGSNSHLQLLDVRNNQITHTGAQELAAALKRNTSLRALDLRWNNLGLLGARALLGALSSNKNIIKLELAGNNVPNDVLRSLETAVDHNSERDGLVNEYSIRQKMLTREIQDVKKERAQDISVMLDKLDRQESTLRNSTKSQHSRILQLQGALEDRKIQFNNMAAKLSLADSELAMSETKMNELGSLLQKARDDQSELAKFHQSELRQMREDRALSEGKLQKEILELNERNLQLQGTVAELELKARSQQEQIYSLKEQLTHEAAENKIKAASFEERLQTEKQRAKDSIREAEDMKQKEIARVRNEAEESEKGLKDRISKLEHHRIELEEDASRLRNQIAAEKLAGEEHLLMAKQRIKNEEDQRCRQLEEKIRLLQQGKDDLQNHATQLSTSITDLQTKNANLVLENESNKHKMEDLQHELSGKNNEIYAETGKVRLEMTQKLQKLETERQTQAELYDRINKLEKELSELTATHRKMNDEKDSKISSLKEQLRSREHEISQMKEEDAQRTSILSNAIQSYVTRSPFPKVN